MLLRGADSMQLASTRGVRVRSDAAAPQSPFQRPPISHTPTASPLVTLLPQAGPAAMALSSPRPSLVLP